jgi:hypothetical protein
MTSNCGSYAWYAINFDADQINFQIMNRPIFGVGAGFIVELSIIN